MTTETSNARGEVVACPLCAAPAIRTDREVPWAPDSDETDMVHGYQYAAPPPAAARGDVRGLVAKWRRESEKMQLHPAGTLADFRDEGYPLNRTLECVEDYACACVSSATEALRAEVERLEEESYSRLEACGDAVSQLCAAEARAERLAGALRDLHDKVITAWPSLSHLPSLEKARAALDQEATNG